MYTFRPVSPADDPLPPTLQADGLLARAYLHQYRAVLICLDDRPIGLLLVDDADGSVVPNAFAVLPELRGSVQDILTQYRALQPALPSVTLRRAGEADLAQIAAMSADWEAEGNVYGYAANSIDELREWHCWLALVDGQSVGYCAGTFESAQRNSSIMDIGTRYFELEELYVRPALRSRRIGEQILRQLKPLLYAAGARMLMLTAVSRNAEKLQRFYTGRAGMTCWSSRMFKELLPSDGITQIQKEETP